MIRELLEHANRLAGSVSQQRGDHRANDRRTDEQPDSGLVGPPVLVAEGSRHSHLSMIAAGAGLHRCEGMARKAAAGRAYDLLCHWLPRGHTGRCEPKPDAERLAIEWYRAMYLALQRVAP